ncbi:peroxiredoxin [Methylopila turkensis]|uniref:thioredoxin-dependent peroxiredoxin n=1 Tax=Methylopila turkensis TaxID=1437816 RepID=A0A9W6JS78_9HYPH|nr:peroxiredoxin [Methylopila turkensis]GLK81095.1 peroxiredoxin [Methylopila turkensis]
MPHALEVGAPAPDFELPAAGGGAIGLRELRGKKVVLYFYPKDDTSGCTAEAIAFNGLRDEFEAAGAVVVGVSGDSVESHDKFRAKYDLQLALGSDETREMLQAYGVWVEKSMYGRKSMGVARTTVLIDGEGRVARVWPKVKVPGHADEVLSAVKEL